jgi:LAS superfamily LD-carboxypeptidase LdcB
VAGLGGLDYELRIAAEALIDLANEWGVQPRITSTVRSFAEQTRLYRRMLQGNQSYGVNPPGCSAHEYGWAFDMVTTPMSALNELGRVWQSWGGGWFPHDPVHFELPGASAYARSECQ